MTSELSWICEELRFRAREKCELFRSFAVVVPLLLCNTVIHGTSRKYHPCSYAWSCAVCQTNTRRVSDAWHVHFNWQRRPKESSIYGRIIECLRDADHTWRLWMHPSYVPPKGASSHYTLSFQFFRFKRTPTCLIHSFAAFLSTLKSTLSCWASIVIFLCKNPFVLYVGFSISVRLSITTQLKI